MDIFQILLSALGVILTALAGWVAKVVINWLNKNISDKKFASTLVKLTTIITSSVKSVFQTYVESLKKSGNFREDAQKEAFTRCKDLINSQLTPDLKEFIKENFGDVEEYIRKEIESTIYSLKNK